MSNRKGDKKSRPGYSRDVARRACVTMPLYKVEKIVYNKKVRAVFVPYVENYIE